MDSIRRKVGSPELLAIEFDVVPDASQPVNAWWGHIWLWVSGTIVGAPAEVEMVSTGLGRMVTIARETGSRISGKLYSLPSNDALDVVVQAIYGDRPDQPGDEDLARFEVLGTSSGPHFEGWNAILLEQGDAERFIYRKEGDGAHEAHWKLGTFRNVVLRAQFELDSLSSERSGFGKVQ